MQYRINLKAGIETRQDLQGTVFVLLDTGAATGLDVKVELAGITVEELRDVKRGLRLRSPSGAMFSSVTLRAAVDCTVEAFASVADLSINYQDGATVSANILGTVPVSVTGQPIAVVPDRGAPGSPVYVSGLTYSDAPATAIIDGAAVAVTHQATAILTANASRKRARFTNLGPNAVTLGTTGHTWAKRCLVLETGDTWVEDDAANLAWVAITETTGNTASVTAQEVLA